MAEYIGCRNCDSPDCKGCNLKNLETMLNNGKFDCLMNENRCINPSEDVATVRHGNWEIVVGSNGKEYMVCTCCRVSQDLTGVFTYCPNCGADMRGEHAK